MGSGERATVFICARSISTSAVVVMRRPDVSSLRMESSVGSVCVCGGGGFAPCSGSEDIYERRTRLLYKHANNHFAVMKAAEVAGVPDEEAVRLMEAFKTYMEGMLRGSGPVR